MYSTLYRNVFIVTVMYSVRVTLLKGLDDSDAMAWRVM